MGQQGVKADLHVFEGQAAEDGDAVVGLLAADRHGVAQALEGLQGKQLIGHLGFLQAEHLGPFLLQPGQHLVEAGAHGVDVPGGDPHGLWRKQLG